MANRLVLLLVLVSSFHAFAAAVPPQVTATLETESAPDSGDAADDPAIWIHPKDPARSLVLGTNKAGGLMVFGMDGKRTQYFDGIQPNNVDVRGSFTRNGRNVGLAVASERKANTLAAWTIDLENSTLTPLPITGIKPEIEVYGFCLLRDPEDGALYGIITSKSGAIEQWRLDAGTDGASLVATRARTVRVPGKCEGCVGDDERGVFFVSEEAGGLWEFNSAPSASTEPRKVAEVAPKGPLVADVEGVALLPIGENGGYLIVSSQGNNTFAVFERAEKHAFLGSFHVNAENGADPVTETDGVDVTPASAGPGFEQGLLVVQDDKNPGGNQNFKFVPWQGVVSALGLGVPKN